MIPFLFFFAAHFEVGMSIPWLGHHCIFEANNVLDYIGLQMESNVLWKESDPCFPLS